MEGIRRFGMVHGIAAVFIDGSGSATCFRKIARELFDSRRTMEQKNKGALARFF